MDRRTFVAGFAAGALGGLAGCSGGRTPGSGASPGAPTEGSTATGTPAGPTPTGTPEGPRVAGEPLPLSKDQLVRGAATDAIPAIVAPSFGTDWSGFEADPLRPDDRVIGIARDGEARAYPLRVLNWHEVANDEFGGPLLVTYCPLCGSAMVAERRVGGAETTFGVSGYLWNADLVMYDERTRSLWSQIAATAVRGPATGERLTLVPAQLTSWGTWQASHPETRVLLPPPASKTVQGTRSRDDNGLQYDRDPYLGYDTSREIGIGGNELPESDVRLHPKAQVLGVAADGEAVAYPLSEVRAAGVVNDAVGSRPVVVTVTADGSTVVAYVRRVAGEVVRFERASETHLRAAGSRWAVSTGRAVDGPHEGATLEPATASPQLFWFAWLDFHPDTAVYRAGD